MYGIFNIYMLSLLFMISFSIPGFDIIEQLRVWSFDILDPAEEDVISKFLHNWLQHHAP